MKQVLIEAAKILYQDYLNYKDKGGSRASSIDNSSVVGPYSTNIRLPSPGQLNIEEDKKRKKECKC